MAMICFLQGSQVPAQRRLHPSLSASQPTTGVTRVCIKNDTTLNPPVCFLSKNQSFLESLSPVQDSTREISLPISSFTGHLS